MLPLSTHLFSHWSIPLKYFLLLVHTNAWLNCTSCMFPIGFRVYQEKLQVFDLTLFCPECWSLKIFFFLDSFLWWVSLFGKKICQQQMVIWMKSAFSTTLVNFVSAMLGPNLFWIVGAEIFEWFIEDKPGPLINHSILSGSDAERYLLKFRYARENADSIEKMSTFRSRQF
jgi:hypothetical protein